MRAALAHRAGKAVPRAIAGGVGVLSHDEAEIGAPAFHLLQAGIAALEQDQFDMARELRRLLRPQAPVGLEGDAFGMWARCGASSPSDRACRWRGTTSFAETVSPPSRRTAQPPPRFSMLLTRTPAPHFGPRPRRAPAALRRATAATGFAPETAAGPLTAAPRRASRTRSMETPPSASTDNAKIARDSARPRG